jgi:hypothetical protein
MCLPRPLPKDDRGKVQCEVRWSEFNPPAGHACSDLPFLSPGPDDRTCLVHQVSASSADASMGEGWYYDEDAHDCAGAHLAIRFTASALAPDVDANVYISCYTVRIAATDEAEADAGTSASDESECVLPKDSARHSSAIGDSCTPRFVPEGGFDERELYVETGSDQCATGACVVYHLSGDPRPDCTAATAGKRGCAKPSDVKQRVYCSMRCDDGPSDDGHGDSSLPWNCGDGFTCQGDAFLNGPEGLRGGYCIRVPK